MKTLGAHVIIHTPLERGASHTCLGFLLQKRTMATSIYPSHWSLIGGHVEAGETPIDALKREIVEEFIDMVDRIHFDNFPITVAIYGRKDANVIVYIAHTSLKMSDIKVRGDESNGIAFFTVEEINHILICPEHRTALDEFIRSLS